MYEPVLGIDLGTSFSTVAWIASDGHVRFLTDAAGSPLIPSAIFIDRFGVHVGQEALRRGREDPDLLFLHTKRFLARPKQKYAVTTEKGAATYSAVDMTFFLLRYLKSETERRIGPVRDAVIGVPVHFTSEQRKLTLQAAEEVGFRVLDLIPEPVAAALAFIVGDEPIAYMRLAGDQTILVYDLGGGSFDLSLVSYKDQRIRVLAADGMFTLGGMDWNQRLMDHVLRRFAELHRCDLRESAVAMRRTEENVEQCKILLSNPNHQAARFTVRYQGKIEEVRVTRADFEGMTEDLLLRTASITHELITKTTHWQHVNHLVPVGGSTYMPMVRDLLDQFSKNIVDTLNAPTYKISPTTGIAHGAAIQARLLMDGETAPVPAARGILAQDIGVMVYRPDAGRQPRPVLHRGTRLPATGSFIAGTKREGQRRILVRVVETDGRSPEPLRLADCVLEGLPANLPARSPIHVRVTCDKQGLLEISAHHLPSGHCFLVSQEYEFGDLDEE